MARGESEEAIRYLELALAEAPTDPYAINRLGALYRHLGETDQAIAYFKSGLEVNPTNTHILSELALTLHLCGNDAEAAHYFTAAEQNRNVGNITGLIEHLQAAVTPGVVIAGLAHEVNNLLEEIHLSLELIRAQLGAPEPEIARALANAGDIGDCALRIHHLLGHFNKRARRKKVSKDRVPVRQMIDFAFDLLAKRLKEAGIRKELRIERPEPPSLLCYQLEMEQLFLNLVANAADALIEAETEDPVIRARVRTVPEPPGLTIQIEDNGPGMPKAVVKRVFDFSFSTKANGRGVGLWLCQFAAETAGGHLSLDSELGKGTTFSLYLPMTEGER
ncbi:MAG: tetratricopeptide repeat protein [bacterium]|nr:tetratricopeptide repeat protein [bacterium]